MFIIRCALRLAPMIFQRPGQLRFAEWEDIHLDRELWRCPPEKMKMREWKKRDSRTPAHLLPLPRQAMAILRDLHPLTGPVFRSMPPPRYSRASAELACSKSWKTMRTARTTLSIRSASARRCSCCTFSRKEQTGYRNTAGGHGNHPATLEGARNPRAGLGYDIEIRVRASNALVGHLMLTPA